MHSSFVSTFFSRSKLVTTRGGTYPATPVIFAAMRLPIQFLQDGINSPRLYAINRMRDKQNTLPSIFRKGALSYNFEAVGDLGGLSQHRCHRAVFELAQLDCVPYRFRFQVSCQPINHLDFCPYRWRLARTLSGNGDLERRQLLALLCQDHNHVHGSAGP